ncbi:MAG: hypothetical protein ABI557_19205, partial [Aureliella sp.]
LPQAILATTGVLGRNGKWVRRMYRMGGCQVGWAGEYLLSTCKPGIGWVPSLQLRLWGSVYYYNRT